MGRQTEVIDPLGHVTTDLRRSRGNLQARVVVSSRGSAKIAEQDGQDGRKADL